LRGRVKILDYPRNSARTDIGAPPPDTVARVLRRAGQTSTQDISMEAERQNQIIARIDDYAERQGLLRRYL